MLPICCVPGFGKGPQNAVMSQEAKPFPSSSSLGIPSDVSLPINDAGLGVGYIWVLAPRVEMWGKWNGGGLEAQGLFFGEHGRTGN